MRRTRRLLCIYSKVRDQVGGGGMCWSMWHVMSSFICCAWLDWDYGSGHWLPCVGTLCWGHFLLAKKEERGNGEWQFETNKWKTSTLVLHCCCRCIKSYSTKLSDKFWVILLSILCSFSLLLLLSFGWYFYYDIGIAMTLFFSLLQSVVGPMRNFAAS